MSQPKMQFCCKTFQKLLDAGCLPDWAPFLLAMEVTGASVENLENRIKQRETSTTMLSLCQAQLVACANEWASAIVLVGGH